MQFSQLHGDREIERRRDPVLSFDLFPDAPQQLSPPVCPTGKS
jgi:hypothetical protein